MEAGTMPRDLLRHRVRVCQRYNIEPGTHTANTLFEFYDEDRDAMFRLRFSDLRCLHSLIRIYIALGTTMKVLLCYCY